MTTKNEDVLASVTAQENWAAAGNNGLSQTDVNRFMAFLRCMPIRLGKVAEMRVQIAGNDYINDKKLEKVISGCLADL